MHNKNVLLGVTGGIAAYKSAELVRRLREAGAAVRVVMTEAAKKFITPLTLQALSGNPIHDDLFDTKAEAAMGHIELARWADVILIAPASADFIAKLAHGSANDLLSTVCLATKAPIIIAPAMNQQMWRDKITQQNIKQLKKYEIQLVGPNEGSQACGDIGPGRMSEAEDIITFLNKLFHPGLLEGQQVLITAGPTREFIDPMRYISNMSSGKMGYALAEACAEAGAMVTLISGRTALPVPKQVNAIQIETAQQMLDAVLSNISEQNIFISAAAVCDYRPAKYTPKKMPKDKESLDLKLIRNPDILQEIAMATSSHNDNEKLFVVGFAAQTEDLLKHAKEKLKQKSCDLLIANMIGLKDRGFDSDNNAATVVWQKGKKEFPLMSKKQLAHKLIHLIAEHYHAKHPVKNPRSKNR
jgi:phosphopantothenoylcysteine decarboxylase / phosphopantothenate---cysteine ligase